MGSRNINIDLIKCLAVFGVVSVHFFVYIGFYAEPMVGSRMFMLNVMRTAFMTCVPLFLLATGYLMQHKTLRGGAYYNGLIRNLIIYVLASAVCILYRNLSDPSYIVAEGIKGIFSFKVTEYAWYMEMYLGLFLLIPFLNIVYHNLESRNAKLALIATVGFLTVGPTVFNLWIELVPDWWLMIWPLTYYYIGCFLKEYPLKTKRPSFALFGFFVWVFCCAVWNYFHAHSMPGMLVDTSDLYWWSSIQNVMSSMFLFIWIQNLDLSHIPPTVQAIVVRISKLSLGLYLTSYVFDHLLYPFLLVGTEWAGARLELYPIAVPLVFFGAFLCSQLISWIYDILSRLMRSIGSLLHNP